MNPIRRRFRPTRQGEQGNFIILGLFFLMLLVLLFFFVQDALRKKTLEDSLQRLADNTALYAAACVPSISAVSFIGSDTELRPWMTEQGYGVGDYVLSAENAGAIDAGALAVVQNYVARNALTDQTSGYFGGNLEVVRVSPKYVVHQVGEGKEEIEYYVEVVLGSTWGSSALARSEDIQTTAIAKAVVEHQSLYSTSTTNFDSPTAISLFANGLYASGYIRINNIRGGNEIVINGDVHANSSVVDFTNNDSASVYGSVSAAGGVDTAGVYVDQGGIYPSPDITWTFPANPSVSPEIYNGPIKTVAGPYTLSGTFPPAAWIAENPEFANGGTLYVQGGTLTVDGTGTDPDIQGDWTFYVDSDLHFNSINAAISDGNNDIVFMVNGAMHMNNLRGPAVVTATIMCTGLFHTNNVKDSGYPFTINGGLYTTGDVHLNNIPTGFLLNANPMPNALPDPFVTYPTIFANPPQYSSPRVTLIH